MTKDYFKSLKYGACGGCSRTDLLINSCIFWVTGKRRIIFKQTENTLLYFIFLTI